ncbi:MAG: glycerol kinase GlpK [Bacteroidia bacterium]|nr:glycerol kinase GlpK [Bacteroidia bacterium]MBT8287980.1 glycerol kinase GlpK [Bacteroidia bacterium]NNK87819.1 glycerol kinase GlpK [Flavobacteriaceae bacterium]
MDKPFILAIDQGTTSSRSILFDRAGLICGSSQQDFQQIFPKPGWVEHDPSAIWESQLQTIRSLIKNKGISADEIAAIGITNQRETTLVWDRETAEPIYNAIVWQDRRTAEFCDHLKNSGFTEEFKQKTGLIIDAYFSATKLKWILDNVAGARDKAKKGELCFGTVDTWLIYKLTSGENFITDTSNASRTMLFNIKTLNWDHGLLALFDIPESMLPKVCESSEIYGYTDPSLLGSVIPIAGIAGDQQAALFGQLCVKNGMAKNTYGTGCFLLMNTGEDLVYSENNLLTTIAWTINGKTQYALEGSVFVGGAAVQWIRDGLHLITDAVEIEDLANSVEDNGGVVFVPALTGLGAPYWDPYARGAIFGLTRGTEAGHIARATLEGIACQVYDIVQAMEQDSGQACTELRVDGGASANNSLMQIQSELFGFKVVRSKIQETTALGAAYLAGLAVGFYPSLEDLYSQWGADKSFEPEKNPDYAHSIRSNWKKAISRSQNWLDS